MKSKLRVVIDTNVLLVSISSRSKYHWIFSRLINGEFEIVVTNDIMMEYEEIISNKFNHSVANDVMKALLLLPNVIKTEVHFKWNLINNDPDDNKFVDCLLNSNANYLITEDKDFSLLNSIDFPKVGLLDIDSFWQILTDQTAIESI